MTSSSHKLSIAPRAQADLSGILQYSLEQWGPAHRDRYAQLLADCLSSLLAFPKLGKERPEIGPNIRSLPFEEHVLLYSITDEEITVVRIAHKRRLLNIEIRES